MMKFNAGYYVNELIQELNVTKQDFANQLQITVTELNDLIEGKILITNEIAQKLSKMLGTSTDVWLKLQKKKLDKNHKTHYNKSIKGKGNDDYEQTNKRLPNLDKLLLR